MHLTPNANGTYSVTSASRPGVCYTVAPRTASAPASCTCPDFVFRRGPAGERCKHLTLVRESILAERRALAAKVVAEAQPAFLSWALAA